MHNFIVAVGSKWGKRVFAYRVPQVVCASQGAQHVNTSSGMDLGELIYTYSKTDPIRVPPWTCGMVHREPDAGFSEGIRDKKDVQNKRINLHSFFS